jgi:hypothetical protein
VTALRTLVAPLVAVTVASGLAVLGSPAGAQQSKARVHDQTYVCTNTLKTGVRVIHAGARRGFRDEGVWRWHASSSISNHGGPVVNLPPNERGVGGVSDANWSFWGTAGLAPAQYQQGDPVFKPRAAQTLRRACARTRARIALSRQGLSGGQASYFEDEYRCSVPRQVRIRFRVAFTTPVSFSADRSSGALRTLIAAGAIREVRIAVSSDTGKPLLYLEAMSGGNARIFTSKGCVPK